MGFRTVAFLSYFNKLENTDFKSKSFMPSTSFSCATLFLVAFCLDVCVFCLKYPYLCTYYSIRWHLITFGVNNLSHFFSFGIFQNFCVTYFGASALFIIIFFYKYSLLHVNLLPLQLILFILPDLYL